MYDEQNVTSPTADNLWMRIKKYESQFPWAVQLASGLGGAHNLSDLDVEQASVSGREMTTEEKKWENGV